MSLFVNRYAKDVLGHSSTVNLRLKDIKHLIYLRDIIEEYKIARLEYKTLNKRYGKIVRCEPAEGDN